MQAYDLLAGAGVQVFSVKTDCFVVKAQDEAKARELLTFDQGIGAWTVSKTEDLIFPFEEFKVRESVDILVSNPSVNAFSVNDECSTSELCDLFEQTHAGHDPRGLRW